MVIHHLKIAWRNLLRDRQFSLLNLVGLSTGLACAILIFLWVNDELQIDKFNTNDVSLYQVMQKLETPRGTETIENTPGLLAKVLSEEIPEVEYAASAIPATWFSNKALVSFNNTHLRAGGQFISKDYFNIFSCKFISGDKNQLFSDNYHIAISGDLALKLFNTTVGIVGKSVEFDQEGLNGHFLISGVFEKFPANATIQFDVLLNYALFLEKNPKLLNWSNNDPNTYVILRKGTDIGQFNKKISGIIATKKTGSTEILFAQRFSDKYLYNHYENGVQTGGRMEYVQLFSVIAIFILMIACINFMNLSTAKASKRLKEVGIKKVMGANRKTIIIQYLSESMLITLFALAVTLVLVVLFLPRFNEITNKHLVLHLNLNLVIAIFAITIITGFVAGSYPALYLSRFKPVTILKGKMSDSIGELIARRGLVIFQFSLSVILIVSVMIVYKQITFVQSKNLGYNREHVIYFEKGGRLHDDKDYYKEGGGYEKELETFMQQVKSIPGVLNASNFRHTIINRHGGTTAVNWEGKSAGNQVEFTDIAGGYDFIETLGIEMKEGRSFSKQFGREKSTVIFNESAIKSMGLKDPVGKTVNIWGDDKQIIGVTRDFHFESLYENIRPCFFDFSLNQRVSKIMVRIKAGNDREVLNRLAGFYKNYTGEPIDYRFLDDDYQTLYSSESRVAALSRYFAAVAIIISCLGLFGLAAFTAQKRQKEISIRKIAGATASNVMLLLSKDFLKQVLVALLIAFPIAWWTMNQWLQGFAYRVTVGAGVFLVALLAVVFITLFTISFQTIRAATANPVKSLRME